MEKFLKQATKREEQTISRDPCQCAERMKQRP